ncbi:Co2+/Mg2+ efflux protein ApaG [bacterium]|nr:Co2+/Mg2+ efflux protein ApaG [bacterium]
MKEHLFSYSLTTNDIRITVFPQFVPNQSDPSRHEYAYAYTVRIENVSKETVQLMRRHWFVFSGGVLYTEVQGDGVVGEQPVIGPGQGFEYSSGCVIPDPVGSMHGTYTLTTGAGESIDVDIPRFDLIYPELVH